MIIKDWKDTLFFYGMWWRIIYGLFRIILGLALIKVAHTYLSDLILPLMSHELIENPSDILYSTVANILGNHPIYISYFLAFYFIFWGSLDTFLSVNLLKEKHWAFPVSLMLIALFVIYEIIRFFFAHSLVLLAVIFIDIAIMFVIFNEYKKLQNKISNLNK